MASFGIYLINLDDSPDRLAALSGALAGLGRSDFHRIPAVDGRKTPAESFPEYDRAGSLREMGRELHGGEVACFLSHMAALRAFLDSGADYALVLEDDAAPTPDALTVCEGLIAWQTGRGVPDWMIAQVGNPRLKYATQVGEVGDHRVYRSHYIAMLATAVLWTRAGAEYFLATFRGIDCPYDNYLRRVFARVDAGIAVLPPLFSTTGADSDIGKSQAGAKRSTAARRFYTLRRLRRLIRDNWRGRTNARNWAGRRQR